MPGVSTYGDVQICGATSAGAVVNKDVPAYALMVGVPARQIGWVSQYGEQLSLPLTGDGQAACPHTRQRYTLQNSVLTTSET